jgi:hypothetical protein
LKDLVGKGFGEIQEEMPSGLPQDSPQDNTL